ncbi:hypothetical protein LUZ60_011583 [Juncus effusus]|nr:hypothetical protein LUZ60_011583 [Juncus effusus]
MAEKAEVESVDFDSDSDDLMDEDGAAAAAAAAPKLRSAITGGEPSSGAGGLRKTKGRGFREGVSDDRSTRFTGRDFDSLASNGGPGPQRSIEGWIVLVTGIHEEAQEDDLQTAFREFGQIKNLHLNLDRRTGFVKGYALIEYESFEEAQAAIENMDGSAAIFEQVINVDWAFSNGPAKRRIARRRSPRARRSRSPPRRRY